jgi:hypothetical protein
MQPARGQACVRLGCLPERVVRCDPQRQLSRAMGTLRCSATCWTAW